MPPFDVDINIQGIGHRYTTNIFHHPLYHDDTELYLSSRERR